MPKFTDSPARIYTFPDKATASEAVKILFDHPEPRERSEANMVHFDRAQMTTPLYHVFLSSLMSRHPINVVHEDFHRNDKDEVHAELSYVSMIQPGSASAVSHLYRDALLDFSRLGLKQENGQRLWERIQKLEESTTTYITSLDTKARLDVIRQLQDNRGGFNLDGLPTLKEVLTPSFPKPPGNLTIKPDAVFRTVKDKIVGLAGGVSQIIKDTLANLPADVLDVIDRFAVRISVVGKLAREGALDKAIAGVVEAVVLLARDVSGLIVATCVNMVVDIVAGLIGGILLARPLTAGEKDFGHRIFHGTVNLACVRVAVGPWAGGMVSANVIYMPSIDLSNNDVRSMFAHELTHVFQDQHYFEPSTRRATYEILNRHFGSGRDQYDITGIDNSTQWNDLGVEQQAELVGTFQWCLDGGGLSPSDKKNCRRILTSVGLF